MWRVTVEQHCEYRETLIFEFSLAHIAFSFVERCLYNGKKPIKATIEFIEVEKEKEDE